MRILDLVSSMFRRVPAVPPPLAYASRFPFTKFCRISGRKHDALGVKAATHRAVARPSMARSPATPSRPRLPVRPLQLTQAQLHCYRLGPINHSRDTRAA